MNETGGAGMNAFTGDVELWLDVDPGNGTTIPGASYETFTVTPANIIGVVTINLSTPFPVINGTLYRLEISPVLGLVRPDASSIDVYSGGDYTANGNYIVGSDLAFQATIATPVVNNPIPTLSQWGLLIFGLLILNLSTFLVQRRELI